MQTSVRTTFAIEDDLLQAIKEIARNRGMTMGQVISELARTALQPKSSSELRNGVPVFTAKAGEKVPHLALVNQLRDED